MHHYHFTVYALDVDTLPLGKDASTKDAALALKNSKHVIATSNVVGTYTLNPALRKAK